MFDGINGAMSRFFTQMRYAGNHTFGRFNRASGNITHRFNGLFGQINHARRGGFHHIHNAFRGMTDFITHRGHDTRNTRSSGCTRSPFTRRAQAIATLRFATIRRRDDTLGSLRHGVGRDDGQTGFGQNFLTLIFVRTFHTHDQRYFEMHLFGRCDHALGNDVAFHDAAENIDQNGFEVRVFQHDFECFGDFLRTRTTTHIQEVRRFATVQFDGVHRGHRQTRTVHEAANVAIE